MATVPDCCSTTCDQAELLGDSQVRRGKLTVAHISEGSRGGVGTAVCQLIEAQANDHEINAIHLFADPKRMGDMLENAPAYIHEYQSSRRLSRIRSVSSRLQRELRILQPDVVFLHSTFPGIYGRLCQGSERVPWTTIYCAHGWAFNQPLSPLLRRLYSMIERWLASRAEAIVSISFSEFDAAVKARINKSLHRVIYHGVLRPKTGISAPIKVNPGLINIGFVGRFDRQKGLDILLEAMSTPDLRNIALWLIGDSTLGQVIPISKQANVNLIGWVPHAEIDSYIQCFDAIVLPSRWEGFGLVALEAMRNGKPVLASRVGGLAELVIDHSNGRLFDPDDPASLRKLLGELTRHELLRMGRIAREIFTSSFEWHHCYMQWKSIMRDALTEHRRIVQGEL
jgi:glycosyltransferase involved in cell wall biosynthesis